MTEPGSLQSIIQSYVKNSSPKPFLKHIDYFRDSKGKINKTSIATNWAKLSKESYFKTLIKAHITMTGANQVKEQKNPGCPWSYDFNSSAEIMPHLKHSRDSDVVNHDGSIDIEKLQTMMTKLFEYDPVKNSYFVRKSEVTEYLKLWAQRDSHLETKISLLMPSWETVAQAEWDDFFLNFVDDWKLTKKGDDVEATVTADTFLQFYFEGNKLYDRVFNGELPVKKSVV